MHTHNVIHQVAVDTLFLLLTVCRSFEGKSDNSDTDFGEQYVRLCYNLFVQDWYGKKKKSITGKMNSYRDTW